VIPNCCNAGCASRRRRTVTAFNHFYSKRKKSRTGAVLISFMPAHHHSGGRPIAQHLPATTHSGSDRSRREVVKEKPWDYAVSDALAISSNETLPHGRTSGAT
jgi:hypothetical protein